MSADGRRNIRTRIVVIQCEAHASFQTRLHELQVVEALSDFARTLQIVAYNFIQLLRLL